MTAPSIEAEIGLAILFCAVDGDISEEELGALASHVGDLLGEDADPLLLPTVVEGELEAIAELGVDDYIASLAGRIDPLRRVAAVRAACAVACTDGLAAEEEQIVRQVCDALSIEPSPIIAEVASRSTRTASLRDEHNDAPNQRTAEIRARLTERGWSDPTQMLRDMGVTLSGFAAVSLQYESPSSFLLRVEHHTCDDSIHFHVTTADAEMGKDYVIFPDGRESDIVEAIVAMQDDVTIDSLDHHVRALVDLARVSLLEDDELLPIA